MQAAIPPQRAIATIFTVRRLLSFLGGLFGREDILDQWPAVETELIKQMEGAIAAQQSIIYDATNFKRSLRLELLQKLSCRSEWLSLANRAG